MKIAWIGPASGCDSAAAARRDALLPHLRELAEVTLFAEEKPGKLAGEPLARPLSSLRPRAFDQVLYALGDEPELAFVLPVLRAVGGTVQLGSWHLPRLARAAFPGLAGRGVRASWLALREGGLEDLRSWRAHRAGRCAWGDLALNRSVVRHADAFVVREEQLARRIRVERNAHTPIAVVPETPPAEEALRLVEALEHFPHARSARRPLVVAALRSRR